METKRPYLSMGIIVIALLLITLFLQNSLVKEKKEIDRHLITSTGVCPPFQLYDEEGNPIDPVHGIHTNKPYSPKQTCGRCHDYEKITQGFHFQQGKDEEGTGVLTERYQWVSHPGNYGGNWCSPAPLYNYLSDKENSSAKEMDMTSFTFITNGCGTCHPGGGSFEYDRAGNRYDKYMETKGYTAGGINDFDGDYYQAHWNRSGVAEGDCNLCHLPEYNFKLRNDHLANWNFRWMATAGSGLASVEGSVKDSTEVKVSWDLSKFTADGKVSMHLVREPRNETCLNCHSKPQWKKRGASFTANTDIHMAKGLKCVDCHVAGSMASDKRISGKEVHQVGKGDDPSGYVRNDLDNTMRTCKECHISGYLNAPVAKHTWLPSLHLYKLSCQACHIPERKVKSALVQVSDVFNPGVKISPPPKYIWTFYDQKLNYWNHYGELTQFTAKDQPADPFMPQYAKYKGQIFPVNAVHSAWPAIYTEGKKGLHQPKMKDIYTMWTAHRKDQTKYPELALIKDDNNDSIPEVNSSAEIDAFIHSVTTFMTDNGYDLKERKIVWVNNDRIYFSGSDYQTMEKETWESSPYASVYKYSHDVFPAKAGLGARGCTDCHSLSSDIFYKKIVKYPFGEDGNPVFEPQYTRLGMGGLQVMCSAIREQYIKTLMYPAFFFLAVIVFISLLLALNSKKGYLNLTPGILTWIYGALGLLFLLVFLKPDVSPFVLPERLTLDKNHFLISLLSLLAGIFTWLQMQKKGRQGTVCKKFLFCTLIVVLLSGGLMMIKFEAIYVLVRIAYSVFDVGIVLILLLSIFELIKNQLLQLNQLNS
jgi:hypothetical protein